MRKTKKKRPIIFFDLRWTKFVCEGDLHRRKPN